MRELILVMIIDQKSIIDLNQFEGSIWVKHNTMDQTLQNYDLDLKGEDNVKKKTDNVIKG